MSFKVPGLPGRYPVPSWQVQRASLVGGPGAGATITQPGYPDRSWYPAPPRSTLMGTLLANGLYPGIESGRAMESVDRSQFSDPWWYRCEFEARGGGHLSLLLEGVIPGADVWLNGQQVAAREQTEGAFSLTRWDLGGLVGDGVNALGLLVHACDPQRELAISWIDWAQHPPDNNAGIWRDVVIERTGPVLLAPPAVGTELELPELGRARLSLRCELTNLSDAEVVAQLRAVVTGPGGEVVAAPAETAALGPRERREVAFTAANCSDLVLEGPAVWWPVGEGAQPIYSLRAEVLVDGLVSSQHHVTFGVRSVSSDIAPGGGRRFYINGRLVPVIAGGWSPDLFLRHDPARISRELAYAVDLGLNAVRLEGKLENSEFFDQADALGVMVLPGWECCSWWEAEKREGAPRWSEADFATAARQASSEALRLRNHPCVICFFIGSDYAPTEKAAEVYVTNFQARGWALPLVSSATAEGTNAAGPSGMKMTGPYSYVPPSYWYARQRGGAIGFNSETSAGATVPSLASLRRMLSPQELADLWQEPDAKQYHAGPPSEFDNLACFSRALAARYGAPVSLEDWVRKAHLANYETVRAQFEAYRSRVLADVPATGMVYWMLNSPWPSLNWQLYDWYLATPAAYFAAKKANCTHAMYDYHSGEILVLNCGPAPTGAVGVTVQERSLEGKLLSSNQYTVAGAPARGTARAVGALHSRAEACFLVLQTASQRNVYWLPAGEDVLDWEKSTFHTTPLSRAGDFSALAQLPIGEVRAEIELSKGEGGFASVHLHLANQGDVPVLGLQATLTGRPGLPLGEVPQTFWDDNYIVLFPGEELALTARAPAADVHGLWLEGFNLVSREVWA